MAHSNGTAYEPVGAPRLRTLLAALGCVALLTWAASLVLAAGASRSDARGLGGDFPAFYGAGRIVAAGQGERLFAPTAQLEAQRDLPIRQGRGDYLMYAYPPFVAAVYAPLTRLPFSLAYALHCLAMLCALAVSVRGVLRLTVGRPDDWVPWTLAALVAPPVFCAVLLGQNSALTLALVVTTARLGTTRRWFAAGAAAGALAFKPQVVAAALLSLLVLRKWCSLAVACFVIGILYALGAAVSGASWPLDWATWAVEFHRRDVELNGEQMISVVGLAERFFGASAATTVSIRWLALIVMVVGAFHARRVSSQGALHAIATACVGYLALSPHALWYELTLLVPALAWIGPQRPRVALVLVVGSALAAYDGAVGFATLLVSAYVLARRPSRRPA